MTELNHQTHQQASEEQLKELRLLLDSQNQTLVQLKSLIVEEKASLSKQDADKLLALSKDKTQCLFNMKTTDEKLANHPHHNLLTTNVDLAQQVAQARAILAECKDINSQNASLIELNIASLNRFAQALQASRNASSLTYNDKGKTSTISTLGNDFSA
ncbi:flagellar protein FlgN [Shewanella frigidimarina]|jgi:flagella synthesis protein FlgN|uniref:Flagellar biosynthesis protein FlgN n=1 Tax=Shewanella frigidimarina TaxID=56812 RepID=A0A125BDW7_SHEFR|nr:flagellar protein FlgN [Shewanella frigidimarina]KVW99934.1 flagellar biosynthesis protein FlgN [Shewanella frigidimarina]